MDYRFQITSKARQDLKLIWVHIAQNDPQAATAFRDKLINHAKSLCVLPHRHPLLAERDVRKHVFQAYLIFYRVNESEHSVEILRFWHGARDQDRMTLRELPQKYLAKLA